MEFAVDILGASSLESLEQVAEVYLSELLHSNPYKPEYVTLPSSRQVPLSLPNVGFVPLYGADVTRKVLALFDPEDQSTAVALYLADRWWPVEEILRTSDLSREGLLKVKTPAERIVLYVLNRIVYRAKEIGESEVPFLCHGETDYAKILWKYGQAIGFYSVKPKGSLCRGFLTQRYLLPVMDSIFVRKHHRGNGHGLQMLEDFVDSFKEDALGLKYPLSEAMYGVCGCYFRTYPADQDLFWEVESIGGPFQRSRVASKIQAMSVRGTESPRKDAGEDDGLVKVCKKEVEVRDELLTAAGDVAVSTHTRSSEFRRKKLREERDELKEILPGEIHRVEEAVTPSEEPVMEEEEEEDLGDEGRLEVVASEALEKPQAVEVREPDHLNGSVGEESESSEVSGEPMFLQESGAREEEDEEQEYAKEEPVDAAFVQSEEISLSVVAPLNPPQITTEAASSLEVAPLPAETEIPSEMGNEVASPREESATPVGGGALLMEAPVPVVIKDKDPAPAAEVKKAEPFQKVLESREHGILDMPGDVDVPVEILSSDEVTETRESRGAGSVEEDTAGKACFSLELAEDDLSQDTVLLVGLKEVSYQLPLNENEDESGEEMEGSVSEKEDESINSVEKLEVVELKDESAEEEKRREMMKRGIKGDERASATEEEPHYSERHSEDDVMEPPVTDIRVLRRRTARPIQAAPKRKYKRLSRPLGSDEADHVETLEEPEEENEEEMLEEKVEMSEVTKEEEEDEEDEKAPNTEEEAAEKSSDDGEEPPLEDRRGSRRKSRSIQLSRKPKAKRRSKT